jgi:hypothetical protein
MSVYHFSPRIRKRLAIWPNEPEGVGSVVRLQRPASSDSEDAFKALTAKVALAQFEAGTLHPGVLHALLAGVGLNP